MKCKIFKNFRLRKTALWTHLEKFKDWISLKRLLGINLVTDVLGVTVMMYYGILM